MGAIITQTLRTIQGEGSFAGTPSIILRLAECNLHCPFCDTKHLIWPKIKDVKKLTHKDQSPPYIVDNNNIQILSDMISNTQKNIKNLIITGGEPFIHIQSLHMIIQHLGHLFNTVEIETNGTFLFQYYIIKQHEFTEILKLHNKIKINISPKLDPRCYSQPNDETTILELVSNILSLCLKLSKSVMINIKLLYQTNDTLLNRLIDEVVIPQYSELYDYIYIMPITTNNQDETLRNIEGAVDLCIEKGFKFGPRLHLLFNEGVRSL